MKKILLFTMLIALMAGTASAQSSFYINLGPGLPQGDYKTKLDGIGFGGTLGFNAAIQDSPIGWGLSFGYQNTGLKSEEHDLSADVVFNGKVIKQIPFYLKSTISNNIILTHLNLRVTSPTDIIKIYGEGLIGFRYLFTSAKIEDITAEKEHDYDHSYDDDDINSDNVLSDFSFSYGAGAGLMIELTKGVALDVRARYLWGTKAKYLNKDDIKSMDVEISSDDDTGSSYKEIDTNFATRSSELDMLFIEAGIAFTF